MTIAADTGSAAFAILPHGSPPELVSVIRDHARQVLNQHGLAAFAMPRAAAVYHEAAHAVLGVAEGFAVRRVSIFSRSMAPFGIVWGGQCLWGGRDGGWRSGPNTSAADDLRHARMIIAGLAGEALAGQDKPGSALDELALSQLVGLNAAVKLADPSLSDEEYAAFAQGLWHREVWGVALGILRANAETFQTLAQQLHQDEQVQGPRLRHVLAHVTKAPS